MKTGSRLCLPNGASFEIGYPVFTASGPFLLASASSIKICIAQRQTAIGPETKRTGSRMFRDAPSSLSRRGRATIKNGVENNDEKEKQTDEKKAKAVGTARPARGFIRKEMKLETCPV